MNIPDVTGVTDDCLVALACVSIIPFILFLM